MGRYSLPQCREYTNIVSNKFPFKFCFHDSKLCQPKIVAYAVRSLSDHAKKVFSATDARNGSIEHVILEFHRRNTGELSDLAKELTGGVKIA